jgi:magnesium chelatase subunit D
VADDLRIEAIKAALPAGLLALMARQNGLVPRGRKSGEASSRAGDRQRHGAQGRPSGTVPGQPQAGHRLSLIDTLRQAAPWQRLRRAQLGGLHDPSVNTRHSNAGKRHAAPAPSAAPAVIVHREDLRVIRREPRRPTTTVFLVDASGSNALNRLAEAKGAVETMLADCYVRRDRVAVIGFRGQVAETLLPPTRSLVRAKRSLAGLPGGGGTPMARALTESRLMCESLQRRGDTVSLVLLTDGKANINLEGKPGREGAHADAVTAARQLFVTGVACLLIDTSPKPQAQARELALAMGARYIPLPQAQAGEIGRIVRNSRAA